MSAHPCQLLLPSIAEVRDVEAELGDGALDHGEAHVGGNDPDHRRELDTLRFVLPDLSRLSRTLSQR